MFCLHNIWIFSYNIDFLNIDVTIFKEDNIADKY